MIELLLILVANTLYIHGLKAAMSEGMILDFIPRKLDGLPEWVKMPLFDCPICMSSVHSYILPFSLYFFGYGWHLLWAWPFYIVMLAGLNGIILKLTKEPENGLIGKDVMVEVDGYGLLQVTIIDSMSSDYIAQNNTSTFLVKPNKIKAIL